MANKLSRARSFLELSRTDLQRSYSFTFRSVKLALFGAPILISEIDHPYFQYENQGDYRGYIASVKKPNDMTITFYETDRHLINQMFNLWDGLKYNKETGIHYPKAAYEDEGFLVYHGNRFAKINEDNSVSASDEGSSEKTKEEDEDIGKDVTDQRRRRYFVQGLYPINRNPVQLSYGSNDVVRIQATFNVDKITLVGVTSLAG